jgi:voltage-gated potassium channel
MSPQIYKKFIWSGAILLIILTIGTIGYWLIGGRQNSFVDTLYMTVITITTIGFNEIIDGNYPLKTSIEDTTKYDKESS